jgi:hypothetical protein
MLTSAIYTSAPLSPFHGIGQGRGDLNGGEGEGEIMGEIVTPPHPCSTWNERGAWRPRLE